MASILVVKKSLNYFSSRIQIEFTSWALTQVYLFATLTAPLPQSGRYLFIILLSTGSMVNSKTPFLDRTQTLLFPTAISPPGPGTSPSMVAINLFESGSIWLIVPSFWFSVQTPFSPAARNRGFGPTGTVQTTLLVLGSIRCTKPGSSEVVIQTELYPKVAQYEFLFTLIFLIIVLEVGSIRDRVPALSVRIQSDPSPKAKLISPPGSEILRGIIAFTLPVR